MYQIAFVDDEKSILDGIRRTLRSYRDQWQMHFYESGPSLLKAMESQNFDVVISDMRMPEMDGAELLTTVKSRSPETLRFALSGYADSELTLEAVAATHQFLAKPSDAEHIKQAITRGLETREWMANSKVKQLIGSIENLPSMPAVYQQLMAEIASGNSESAKLGDIISSDIALTTEILRVVNSAFFGLVRHIDSPAQAVSVLGTETVKNLALMTSVFSAFKGDSKIDEALTSINQRSQLQGMLIRKLARRSELNPRQQDHAQLAAMTSLLGELIYAAYPEQMLESDIEPSDSPELAAYLLSIWAMPSAIVDAVRWHRKPSQSQLNELEPLTLLHVVWAALETQAAGEEISADMQSLDHDYLQALGCTSAVSSWVDDIIKNLDEQGD